MKPTEKWFANNNIRSPKVICIDQSNTNLGIMQTWEAIKLAQSSGLDLVQMGPSKESIPTCKIIDFGKYKYEASKKRKESDKKQRENAVKQKEIKFRPSTSQNDLETKARQTEGFLNDGCKVKITVVFLGREMSHPEVGSSTLEHFLTMIGPHLILDRASMEGRQMSMMIKSP